MQPQRKLIPLVGNRSCGEPLGLVATIVSSPETTTSHHSQVVLREGQTPLKSLSFCDRESTTLLKETFGSLYQRSQEIERMLETVLRLLGTGRESTPTIADVVGV
jgi:hypothetical protein